LAVVFAYHVIHCGFGLGDELKNAYFVLSAMHYM
jgi:hypothetical protein